MGFEDICRGAVLRAAAKAEPRAHDEGGGPQQQLEPLPAVIPLFRERQRRMERRLGISAQGAHLSQSLLDLASKLVRIQNAGAHVGGDGNSGFGGTVFQAEEFDVGQAHRDGGPPLVQLQIGLQIGVLDGGQAPGLTCSCGQGSRLSHGRARRLVRNDGLAGFATSFRRGPGAGGRLGFAPGGFGRRLDRRG